MSHPRDILLSDSLNQEEAVITLRIGDVTRELQSPRDVDPSWINEQIRTREADGQPVCFQITIQALPVELNLPAGRCARGNGGGRPLRPQEQRVVDLWRERRLDEADVRPGLLVSFLKQVFSLLA